MATRSAVRSESAVRGARDLVVAVGRLRRRLRDVAGFDDLTPSQTSVISRLSKDGQTTASALATAERVRPQSMAATLAALAERGLIARRPDPQDGRRQLITLTRSGRAQVEDGRAVRREWLVQVLQARCTESERQTLVAAAALMERLADL